MRGSIGSTKGDNPFWCPNHTLTHGTGNFKMFTNGKTIKNSYEPRDMFPNPIMHFMGNQVIMSVLLPLRYDVG